MNFDSDGDVNLAGERRRLHEQQGYGTADTSGVLSFAVLDVCQRAIEFFALRV